MKRVDVLKLMAEGWELGVSSHGGDSRVSIQKGGQGRGGEARTVSWTVYEAMRNRGEIEMVQPQEKYWLRKYRLVRIDKRNA